MGEYTPQSSMLGAGRIGQAAWAEAIDARTGRPDGIAISLVYHIEARRVGLNPDLALAQACEETGYFTSRRWVDQCNPCGLGIVADDTPGHVFASEREGIIAHLHHLCCYAYTDADCPAWHPDTPDFRHLFHDGNPALSHLQDSTRQWATKPGYVGRILAIANAVLAAPDAPGQEKGPNMPTKPPMTTKPSPNKGGYATPHKPEAIVWHVTVGGAAGSLSWLTNPASNASANYLIDRTGKIYELVPPNESAWANGQLNKPDLANPVIKGWVDGKLNPNTRTISIEMERITSANEQPGGFTEAQHNALVSLSAWLCASLGIAPDRTHIIRHGQIDSVTRLHCPGLAEAEMQAWIGEIAALVNPSQPPPFQHAPGFIGPPLVDNWNWGKDTAGIIVERHTKVYNDQTGRWYWLTWDDHNGIQIEDVTGKAG